MKFLDLVIKYKIKNLITNIKSNLMVKIVI